MSESQPGRPQGGNVTRSRTLGQKLQRSSLVAAEDDLRSQFWRPHYREIADKMGELTKQGRDSLFRGAKWERRFCLLQDDNLFYFKRREDELPIGVMSIKNATIIKEHSHDHKPCISITAQESHNFESQKSFAQRTYNFLANSDDDCEQWVRALALAGQRTTGRRSQSVSGFGHSRRSNSDSSSLVANLSLNQPGREKDREAFLNGSSSSSSATTTTTTTSSSSSSSLPPSSPYKPVTTGQSSMLSPSQSTPAAAAALPPARPPKPATADSPKAANGTSGGLLISGGPPARPPKKPAAAANSVPMSDTLNLDDLLKPNMTDHAAQCSWITPAGALSSDIDTFIDEIELINTDLSKATSLPTAAQTIPDADFIVSPVTRIVQASRSIIAKVDELSESISTPAFKATLRTQSTLLSERLPQFIKLASLFKAHVVAFVETKSHEFPAAAGNLAVLAALGTAGGGASSGSHNNNSNSNNSFNSSSSSSSSSSSGTSGPNSGGGSGSSSSSSAVSTAGLPEWTRADAVVQLVTAGKSLCTIATNLRTCYRAIGFFETVETELALPGARPPKNGQVYLIIDYVNHAMLQAVEAVNVEHKSRYVDVTTVLVDVAGRIIKATDAILPQLGPSVLSAPSSPSLSRATSHTSIDQSDPSQPFLPGDSSVIRKNRTELTQFVSQMVTHTKLAVGVWPAPNACIDMLVMLMASAQGILRLLGCVQMCSAWSQYRADLHNLLRLKYSTDARFNGTGTSTSATPTTPTASAAATATPSPVGGTGTERPKISLPTADAPEDPTLANRRKARISSYNGTGAPTLIPTSLALVDMIRKIGHDLCINTVISSTLERLIATINRITTSLSNDLRVDRRDAAIEHAMNLSAATAQVVEEVDAMELNFIDVGVRFRWDSCKTELAVCIDDFKSIRFMITGITAPTPQGIDRYIAVTKSVSVSCQHLLTAAKAVIEHQEQLLVQHHRDQDAHIKSHATARHKMNQLTVAFNKHSDAFANRVTDTQTLPPIAQSPPNSASQPATPTIPRPSPLSGSSTPATGSTGSSSTPSLTGSLGSSQTNSLTNSLPTSQTNSLSNSLAASSLSSSMNDLSMEDGIVFGEEVAGDGKEAPVRPVKGGTLVKLVERLTFQSHPDPQFTTAFLLTYRSFTDPLKLLDLLIERYSTQPPDILVNQGLRDKYMTETIVPIRLRVFNALKLWINTNWDDFKSDDVLQARLKAFLDIMSVDLDTAAQHLRRLLERKWTVGDIGRKFVFDSKLPTPIIHQNIRQSSQILTVLDIDPLELARQLTIIDWKEHAAIQPKECLDLAWTKKDREQAPHILAMIDLATRLSFWVASAILSEDAVKARAKVVAHFIMVAEKCRSLNNFNAVMAVLAGMSNAAVYRLKKTWEALPNKVRSSYSELKELMSEQNNFGRYRQVLHSIDPPCIPFLGIYLTDLVMIESGNKNFIKGTDLINFDKRRKIASVIQEIQQYQQSPYHLQEVEPIAQFIANVPFMESKDEMYEKSLILEPRDGSTPAAAKQPTNTIGRTGMRKNSVAPPTFSKEA